MTVPVWVAISEAGYPNYCLGMFLNRKDLLAHYRNNFGRDLRKGGYHAVRAMLDYTVPIRLPRTRRCAAASNVTKFDGERAPSRP